MKEKIQLLIKNEGLTQSRLAEILEIQPANVSHILSGRSKPGFELLQKILRRFPRLSPDWLLLDRGEMYRTDDEEAAPAAPSTSSHAERPVPNFDSLFATAGSEEMTSARETAPRPNTSTPSPDSSNPPTVGHGRVSRVVVFYSDHTFESFEPKG
uniref:helix-turn-helix domain-containing protein n=1 Tax=Alistipes sp. TaxID=1872444 RepID=UPI0040560ED4